MFLHYWSQSFEIGINEKNKIVKIMNSGQK